MVHRLNAPTEAGAKANLNTSNVMVHRVSCKAFSISSVKLKYI